MTTRDHGAAALETLRRALTKLAYRMLALRAEAEDDVQDAYLRWHAIDRTEVKEPYRYLATVVTRFCLDRMKSARARCES
ncbi:sigma factor [Bradyrhizobium sp. CCBAU 53351]|jgi:RNA polymerase sigma-70 factor (ECF subfamily)|uniref:sigma factor n=1 Tax=Bradyrhizobium sp. CCBAU 53351 TaxID=1325114 RepID=UPI001FF02B62|nr:sigma factor [Bradyrhizobium sp. CCBAU 53351]